MRPSLKSLALALPFLAAACDASPYRVAGPAPQTAAPPVATGPAVATGPTVAPGPVVAPPPGTDGAVAGSTAPPAFPATPVRMSAAEVAAVLSNNTATGVTKEGRPYDIYFAGDGRERFREGANADTGTWRVLPDGRFCSTFVKLNDRREHCYIMYRTGDTISFQAPDGVSVGSVAVTPGNPQRL